MSSTLARKLRRIGLERCATINMVKTLDEQGNITEGTYTTYETHRRWMSKEELADKRAEIIQAWRARRKNR